MRNYQNLLNEYIFQFNSLDKNNIEKKFEAINLIIQIEGKVNIYEQNLYKHIKIWMNLYIKNVEKESYSYDEISFEKVISIIKKLSLDEQISIIKYFIRLLKKNLLDEYTLAYEEKIIELELILLEQNNKKRYLLKLATKNVINLTLSLIIFILIISTILCIFDLYLSSIFSVELTDYSVNKFINFNANLIAFIFGIDDNIKTKNLFSLICFLTIKLFFYIMVTYFITNKISQRVNQL